jgi:hypothetical protein
MLAGQCLCGGVRFEISGKIGPVVYCHCSMYRRATGSAFATGASVESAAFRIVEGASLISEYQSSPGYFRNFCSRCGSPLYGRSEEFPSMRRVRLGTIDGNIAQRPVANIFVGTKAPWFDVTNSLETFEEFPPPSYFVTG